MNIPDAGDFRRFVANMNELVVAIMFHFSTLSCAVPTGRVVGGSDVPLGKYPYQVYLEYYGGFLGGGSILSERYVLTAAHCIYGRKVKGHKVVAGVSRMTDTGDKYLIDEFIVHEGFNIQKKVNDIGLIRVIKDIKFTKTIQPIALPDEDLSTYSENAVLTGWGKLASDLPPAETLQEIELTVIPAEECQCFFTRSIVESQICTLTDKGKGACSGDSGGPLVLNGTQIGIVSFGRPCAIGYPDVYTKVYSHINWIHQNMKLIDVIL